MNKYREIAINLFLDFFKNKYKLTDVNKIVKIHHGFTNFSYMFKLKNGEKYQIRIGNNNNIVDRNNEYLCLKTIGDKNYIFYDIKNGNSIKKWINGRTLKKKDLKNITHLKNIFNLIDKLHSINIKNTKIKKHDYYIFLSNVKLSKKYLNLYKKIVDNLSTISWGFSHNDLNLKNIILTSKNEIEFIDFEWSRINHPYWDFANLIKEIYWKNKYIVLFSKIQKLDYKLLLEMSYVAICFSYQWTFSNSFSLKILTYRIKMFFKMFYFYQLIKKVEFCR